MVKRIPVRSIRVEAPPVGARKQKALPAANANRAVVLVAGIGGITAGVLIFAAVLAFLPGRKSTGAEVREQVANATTTPRRKTETTLPSDPAVALSAQTTPRFGGDTFSPTVEPAESSATASDSDVNAEPRLTITSPPSKDSRFLGLFPGHASEAR